MRYADQCKSTPGGKDTIALDQPMWLLLNAVNTTVNGAIWPEDDLKHYGRTEYWTIPTDGYGDCEDYALMKRRNLLQAGLPAQALRLAVVDSPASGRHAVLTVATDKGDYVLDNLSGEIRSWRATDYAWIERQDATNPMTWVSLSPAYAEQQGEQPTATGSAAANLDRVQQSTVEAPTPSTAMLDSSMQLSAVVRPQGPSH
jgi:predicted transglutaminase-like cysteine proteinase